MKKLKITQIRSTIGATKKQRATMDALKLRKINAVAMHAGTPCIQGMLAKVRHLIKIE